MEAFFSWSFWQKVLYRWRGALCWERGAAMAFFALFSIAPLFVLLLSFLDRLFGVGIVRGDVYTTLVRALGTESADAIRALLLQPSLFYGTWTSTITNVVLTAIGSAALFRHMQRCLAAVWSHTEAKTHGASYFFGTFLRSFFALGALTIFVVGGLFVLASAILFGPLIKRLIFGATIPVLWPIIFAWITLLGSTGIFAVLYATLSPDQPSRRRLLMASTMVFILLIFSKVAIGSFSQSHNLFSLFGAGSAVVYLILWCFLLAQIFLFAAVVAGVKTER